MATNDLRSRTERWLELIRPYRSGHRSERLHFAPENSALLVIDMQRYFLEESSHGYLPLASEMIGNVRMIVDSYRATRHPVIFTRHAVLDEESPGVMGAWWGDTLMDSDPLSEIVSVLRPRPTELVIRKTRYSAFAGTSLHQKMKSLGVKRILITGVMTHLCCESTARDAFIRDYEVFFVVDGTASRDEDLHTSSLRTMTDGFAMPMTAEEVLQCLRE